MSISGAVLLDNFMRPLQIQVWYQSQILPLRVVLSDLPCQIDVHQQKEPQLLAFLLIKFITKQNLILKAIGCAEYKIKERLVIGNNS